jgi:hypothetical protein
MFAVVFVFAALHLGSADQSARPRTVVAADSVRIVRAARSAQISFEAFRRAHLPPGDSFSGPCDVTIGRYCYGRGDDDDDDRPPPPERPDVRERRAELVRQLDSATSALPGDAWLAGQRVRYLVEADRPDDALHFALHDCRAGVAWCNALGGYAAQQASRFALADSAFNTALAAMGEAERCRWLDISSDLDGAVADRFDAVACAGREAFVRRLLWLGAPLYSVSGSDLFTEHLARVARARIAEHAATTDGDGWGDDARELALRYGFTRWYTRVLPAVGSMLDPMYVGHDASLPFDFIPSLHAVDSLGSLSGDDWHLDDPHAQSGYAPTYAHTMHDLPAQIATFRRGDSTLIVASWDARRDTSLAERPLDAALAVTSSPDSIWIARQDSVRGVGRLTVEARVDSGVVSVEVLAARDRHAARRRVGLPARTTARVALSDLLLFAPPVSGPTGSALEQVRDSALTSDVMSLSRPTGVYWETYGLRSAGETVRYSLRVEPVAASWLHRAAERLHLAGAATSARVQWQEVPHATSGIAARSVRLDLTQLKNGRYRMELTAAVDGEAPVTAWREIVVR